MWYNGLHRKGAVQHGMLVILVILSPLPLLRLADAFARLHAFPEPCLFFANAVVNLRNAFFGV